LKDRAVNTALRRKVATDLSGAISLADDEPGFDPRRIIRTRHALADHPLLEYAQLRKLALSLSGTRHVRQAARYATIKTPFKPLVESDAGRSIAEAFDNIHLPGTWIALYSLEEIPEYRAFLRELLAEVLCSLSPQDSDLIEVGGFAFIAGPMAVWPFHLDRDSNFHIQIRGRKEYRLWSPGDPSIVPESAVEAVVTHSSYDDVRYTKDLGGRCIGFSLAAGEGVHIPGTAPLTIRTSAEPDASGGPAISMALTYHTSKARRSVCIYAANAFLRKRFGVDPVPPGRVRLADAIKFPIGRALISYQRWGWGLAGGASLVEASRRTGAPEETREPVAAARSLTSTEAMVLRTFGEIFGRRDLGPDDDFFALNGTSVMAMRLMRHLQNATGLELPLRLLFEHPTSAALAGAIDLLSWAEASPEAWPPVEGREQFVV
jgi:hypothetical protein